jgi:hypothetical protein
MENEMESIEKPVVVEYEAFDEDAPEVVGLPVIETKDWSVDPWPKVGFNPEEMSQDGIPLLWVKQFEGCTIWKPKELEEWREKMKGWNRIRGGQLEPTESEPVAAPIVVESAP